jgi:plasmid stabilization system protein ParE
LVGAGVGFAGTPASNSLTGSVPVHRAGMASATADLQRDLGGAVMQSILGALLTAGYAGAVAADIASAPAADQDLLTEQVQRELQSSFASAADTAERYPQYQDAIVGAAREAFVDGQHWAYLAGIVAVVLGAAVVALRYPDHAGERRLLEQYHRLDGVPEGDPGAPGPAG